MTEKRMPVTHAASCFRSPFENRVYMNQTESTVRLRSRVLASRVVLALAVVLGASLVTASPASAHTAYPGLHMLCKEATPCINSGNLVRFWQRHLWADEGYSDIDGAFGSNTHNATVRWQQLYNATHPVDIDVDGWVGPETWEAASQNSVWGYHFDKSDGTYLYYTYYGRKEGRTFLIRDRISDGVTWFKMPGDRLWTDTSHGS
ncbi:peptidoglycan-binding protein [Micromonospora sp. NBC_00389]|uniref:peptidoglycan-binding domain-containing protein n=1 Tax=Micromonospora sp. NBC_00389 TaxID=2903586 RepID=UPI002E23D9AB